MHSTAWGRTLAATHCGTVTPLRGLSSPSVNRVLGLSHYSCSPRVKGTCTSGVTFCGWGPPRGWGSCGLSAGFLVPPGHLVCFRPPGSIPGFGCGARWVGSAGRPGLPDGFMVLHGPAPGCSTLPCLVSDGCYYSAVCVHF